MSYRAHKKTVGPVSKKSPVKKNANPYYISDSESDNEKEVLPKIVTKKASFSDNLVQVKTYQVEEEYPPISNKKTNQREENKRDEPKPFSYAAALAKAPEPVKKEVGIPFKVGNLGKPRIRVVKHEKKPFNVRTDNWGDVESDSEDEYEFIFENE